LSAKILSTASGLVASAPIPQTESVGYKMVPPFFKAAKAQAISSSNKNILQINHSSLKQGQVT